MSPALREYYRDLLRRAHHNATVSARNMLVARWAVRESLKIAKEQNTTRAWALYEECLLGVESVTLSYDRSMSMLEEIQKTVRS